MRISDWSSDVCSSDLAQRRLGDQFRFAGEDLVAVALGRQLRELLVEFQIVSDDGGNRRRHGLVDVARIERRAQLLLGFPAAQEGDAPRAAVTDRKSVVSGKSVSVRVDLGGRVIIKKKETR